MITKDNHFLIILSAPSGGGKSTILNEVLKVAEDIDYSVSYTTRHPRGTEQNGIHYHFVTEKKKKKRIREGDFLEYAKVFGNWYGTSKSFIRNRLAVKHHVILDIDVQGASLISSTDIPYVKIFILPPSMEVLHQRLVLRATDSEEEIAKRLQTAKKEVAFIPQYDYLVINDKLEIAVQDVLAIIRAEENRVSRYHHPARDFISTGENR